MRLSFSAYARKELRWKAGGCGARSKSGGCGNSELCKGRDHRSGRGFTARVRGRPRLNSGRVEGEWVVSEHAR